MSISLPKEVQTQKVKTLPDDLKAIAEEMLGEKFGEEVVEQEAPAPFPGPKQGRRTWFWSRVRWSDYKGNYDH